MEEHDALHGKLQKEFLAIATAEVTAAAPKAAKKEVVVTTAKSQQRLWLKLRLWFLKDAKKTARGLAMKEVEARWANLKR